MPLLLFGTLASTTAAACPLPPLQQAVAERAIAPAIAALGAIEAAGEACGAARREWAGRLVALLHVAAAEDARVAGREAEARRLVEAGLLHGRPWQAHAMLGDLLQRGASPDFAAASVAYQTALTDINDTDEAANPVPPGMVERLFRLAQQTRLLAEEPVATPPTRGGAPGGLAMTRIRAVRIERVSLPVQFDFGTDRFTPAGLRAVREMAAMLAEAGRPAILLIGHTDPVGGAEANMVLSRRRAAAVGAWLVQHAAYPAERIRIEGRGREDPLPIEGRDGYTMAQVHQMLRRVELVRR